MKRRTRFIALFLAVMLLVGSVPNSAAAIGGIMTVVGRRTSETTYTSEQGWSLTFDSTVLRRRRGPSRND